MYYAHFGLTEAPFRITPNTEVFFAGANRGAILDALIYAISQGEGIIKVTGEVGTGKTMLCNMLQSRLPPTIETVYLAHPSVSPEEILHAIAFELQLGVVRDASRMEVMHALYGYLLQRHAENKQVVIFIEESQNMPIATLEEVRLLSNLETAKHKLLQIILFGQPELDENLRQPNIRQLRERITHSFALPPLSVPEVGEYLMFRMRAVGYRGPDLFNPGVIKRIAQGSAGLTRRINLIADKALLVAFAENTHTIRPKHVDDAVRDSEFSQEPARRFDARYAWGVGSLALGIALGFGVFALIHNRERAPVLAATAAPTPAATRDIKKENGNLVAADPPRASEVVTAAAGDAKAAPTPNRSERSLTDVRAVAATAPQNPVHPQSPVATRPAVEASGASERAAASADTPTPVPSKVTPKASEKAVDQESDPLEARLAATQQWLKNERPGTYSIQVLGSDNPEQLREHLKVISKTVEMNKIFVYRTIAKEKPSLTVLYGSFDDYDAAKAALRDLPKSLKGYRPLLRTVQGIQGEIRRHQTSALAERSSS